MDPAESEAPRAATSGRLLNVLGLAFGLAGSVGGTIGAGILRTPGLVAAQLPSEPWILLIWLLGGLYALLGACCIAELAAALPRAGGWYVYANAAFGRRAGLVVGWCDWVAHCIGLAWVATTLGDYLAGYLNDPAGLSSRWIALTVLGLFSGIQLLGVRAGGASQELLSLAKAGAFMALVLACFLLPQPAAVALKPPAFTTGMPGVVPLVLALQAVITTYDGWASPVYFAEEFSDPSRDLPRSLIGGVVAVLVLYLLINLALLHVLPISTLATSHLPAATAARALVGPWGGLAITAIALVALLGLINTVVMAAPRIVYALGRDGLLPTFTAGVNTGGTPVAALLLTVGAAGLLVLAGSFERLLAIGAVLYVLLPLSGLAALAALRMQQPELARPFRCWLYPLTPLVVGGISIAFLVATSIGDPLSSLIAAGLAALGLVTLLRTPGEPLSPV
jgi:APA family basic amino acid/polyamine antiporter